MSTRKAVIEKIHKKWDLRKFGIFLNPEYDLLEKFSHFFPWSGPIHIQNFRTTYLLILELLRTQTIKRTHSKT